MGDVSRGKREGRSGRRVTVSTHRPHPHPAPGFMGGGERRPAETPESHWDQRGLRAGRATPGSEWPFLRFLLSSSCSGPRHTVGTQPRWMERKHRSLALRSSFWAERASPRAHPLWTESREAGTHPALRGRGQEGSAPGGQALGLRLQDPSPLAPTLWV